MFRQDSAELLQLGDGARSRGQAAADGSEVEQQQQLYEQQQLQQPVYDQQQQQMYEPQQPLYEQDDGLLALEELPGVEPPLIQQDGDALQLDGEHVALQLDGMQASSDLSSQLEMGRMGRGVPPALHVGGKPERHKKSKNAGKGPVAPKRNWLRIDTAGNTVMVQADRSKLIHKLGVQARDLRILDPSLATNYPSALLCRDKALVVNLEYIKVIITTNAALVMNPDDESVLPFITELKSKLSQPAISAVASFPVLAGLAANLNRPAVAPNGPQPVARMPMMDMPFELKGLEVCLESIWSHFDRLAADLEAAAYPALDGLTANVSSTNLERVRRIKSRLVRLTTRVETIREILEKLLDDDKDMHDMNLSAKEASDAAAAAAQEAMGTPHGLGRRTTMSSSSSSSHSSDSTEVEQETAEVEMLLSAYFMQLDNTFNRLQTLNEYIEDTEDLVNLKLDQHRNQLIGIDLMLTAFTSACALITTVAGVFGMNLYSGIEDSTVAFMAVTWTSVGTAVLMLVGFISFLWYRQLLIW